MKILYDHQIFTLQKYGGISRYFYELVRGFRDVPDVNCEISLLVSNNRYISDKKFVNHIDLFPNIQFRGKPRLFNFFNKLNTILKLKQQNFDVFHPTYYDTYFLKYLYNKPFVLTVHDMIHEKFSKMFPPTDKTTERKKILVEKAAKIITVSMTTKKDLIEIFGTDESKIEVVYHGNSIFPKPNIDFKFDVPKKYLLFVGSRGGYKNFDKFVKSVSELLKQNKDLFVICIGGGRFNRSEIKLFNELGISKQILQYDIDDNNLAYFYKNAIAFIFPSLYEGFGFPILESFACGCPVACSDTGSFPEIAGDAAYYFDPYNEESMKNAIIQLIKNDDLRKELIVKGKERLKLFSWKKTVVQMKKIYESVLR